MLTPSYPDHVAEVNQSTPKMREVARRLIAYETSENKHSETNPVVFRVCDKLRRALEKLAGAVGFRSLLTRSLALAKAEVPWLGTLQIKADGVLEWPADTAQLEKKEMARGEVVLVAQLLGLLVTFIGEPLTLLLVQQVWKTPIKEMSFSRDSTQEKT